MHQYMAMRQDIEALVKVEPVPVMLKFPPIALNALTMPRRIAIPLLPKVKAELQWMKNIGVIQRVEEPQIGVPKPNGRVQICVDLTKLNLTVCHERHILPSVRRGATVF